MPGNEHNLAPGSTFGQYQIVRMMAAGGMAAVYEARHSALKKRVALKILFPNQAMRADAVTRFMREGEAAARIRHPHVVDVSDVGAHDGLPFLVMEYLDGEDLATRIERDGALSPQQTVAIIVPVISALTAAHDAGVVHRDLKPENIFLTKGRTGEIAPKVLDFGISKMVDLGGDAGITRTTAIMGTPYYMSPEQTASGKYVDARTDQYSLGVVLYECLTGTLPFEGDSLFDLMKLIVNGKAPPPSQMKPNVPPGLDAVVLKAMHRDAAERYPSLAAFARELLEFGDDKTRQRWADEFVSEGKLLATIAVESPAPPRESRSMRPLARKAAEPARTSGTEQRSDTVIDSVPAPGMDFSVAGLVGGRTRKRTWLYVAAGAGVLVLIGAVAVGLRSSGAHAPTAAASGTTPPVTALRPPTFRVEVNVTPSSAALELDGVAAGAGTINRELPRDGHQHVLRASAPGYESQTLAFRDDPPLSSVELVPISVAPTNPPNPANPTVASAHVHAPGTVHPSAPILPATLPGEHPNGEHTTGGQNDIRHPRSGTSAAGTNGAPILN